MKPWKVMDDDGMYYCCTSRAFQSAGKSRLRPSEVPYEDLLRQLQAPFQLPPHLARRLAFWFADYLVRTVGVHHGASNCPGRRRHGR